MDKQGREDHISCTIHTGIGSIRRPRRWGWAGVGGSMSGGASAASLNHEGGEGGALGGQSEDGAEQDVDAGRSVAGAAAGGGVDGQEEHAAPLNPTPTFAFREILVRKAIQHRGYTHRLHDELLARRHEERATLRDRRLSTRRFCSLCDCL